MLGWRIFQHVHLHLEGIEFAQLTRVFFIAFENSTSMIDRFLCWSVGNHRAQLCCPRLPTHHSGKQWETDSPARNRESLLWLQIHAPSSLHTPFSSAVSHRFTSPNPSLCLPASSHTNVLSLTWTAVPSVWGLPTGRTSYQQHLLLSYV